MKPPGFEYRKAEAITSIPEKPKREKYYHHTKPRSPAAGKIDNDDAHMLTSEVLFLMGWKHSTLHNRLKHGEFPAPDGKDGRLLYWHARTIRPQGFLRAESNH